MQLLEVQRLKEKEEKLHKLKLYRLVNLYKQLAEEFKLYTLANLYKQLAELNIKMQPFKELEKANKIKLPEE